MSSTACAVTVSLALKAHKVKMTRIVGDIAPEAVDNLEEELADISTSTTSTFLPEGARLGDKLPSLVNNNLISVSKLADYGYVSIFGPKGQCCKVFKATDLHINAKQAPDLQGRQVGGLGKTYLQSTQPKIEDGHLAKGAEVQCHATDNACLTTYNLPSICAGVAYTYACLGFPTNTTMLMLDLDPHRS